MFLIRQLVDFSLVIFKGNCQPLAFCMISPHLPYDLLCKLIIATRFRFLIKLINVSICIVGTMI